MSFEKITQTNIVEPAKRVYDSVSRARITSMPQTLFADIVKEGALLPLRNLGQIMQWTGKSMMSVLGSTLKTGLLAASLIPLPIPGKNVAGIQRDLRDVKSAFNAKVQGDPRSFSTIVEQINSVRKNTESQAIRTPQV